MTPKLILKDGKIMFVENWPEEPPIAIYFPNEGARMRYENAFSRHKEACEVVLSGALEVENPIIAGFDSCTGTWYKFTEPGTQAKSLFEGDSFDLPGNVGWEVVTTCKWSGNRAACGNETCWDLNECQKSPEKKIVCLHHKFEGLMEKVIEGVEPIEEAHGESQTEFDRFMPCGPKQKPTQKQRHKSISEKIHNAQQQVIDDKKSHIEELEKTVAALESRNEELFTALKELYEFTPDFPENKTEFDNGFVKAIYRAKTALLNHEGNNKQNEDEGN